MFGNEFNWNDVTTREFCDIKIAKDGDIVKVSGKNYQILKKTVTSVSLTRHYWWNALFEKYFKKRENA